MAIRVGEAFAVQVGACGLKEGSAYLATNARAAEIIGKGDFEQIQASSLTKKASTTRSKQDALSTGASWCECWPFSGRGPLGREGDGWQ